MTSTLTASRSADIAPARVLAAVAAVAARDGVAPVSALRAHGHSRHVVSEAIARGLLVRVRRDWVALPGADPELVAAARHGVVLSCITQAARLGLWVLAAGVVHVAAPPHARLRSHPDAHVHWMTPVVPRVPGILVDPVENVLAAIACCQPHEAALAVWESALDKGLVALEAMRRLALPPAARLLVDVATPFSGSGLETLFRTRLAWLRVRIVAQTWIAGHRVDFLIGDRLVVQIDGGHHVGAQRTEDIRHDAQLALLGYHVLRFSYAQIIHDWAAVQDTIARAIAQGLHLR